MTTTPCTHPATERTTRTAHGYLGDAPAGTVETLCTGCGALISELDARAASRAAGRHGALPSRRNRPNLGRFAEGDRVSTPNNGTGTVIARLGYVGRNAETPSFTVALDAPKIDVNLPESALRRIQNRQAPRRNRNRMVK